jgi:hypothetical protein
MDMEDNMQKISKVIINIKRKLCTVCINGVHYEYVGSHFGDDHSYAEHCPCDNQPIRELIHERLARVSRKINHKRSKITWH